MTAALGAEKGEGVPSMRMRWIIFRPVFNPQGIAKFCWQQFHSNHSRSSFPEKSIPRFAGSGEAPPAAASLGQGRQMPALLMSLGTDLIMSLRFTTSGTFIPSNDAKGLKVTLAFDGFPHPIA